MKKAGNKLRQSTCIDPKTKLATHPEETDQEIQSSKNTDTYPLQQRTDSHTNHEPYDSTVMGSHPPIEGFDNA